MEGLGDDEMEEAAKILMWRGMGRGLDVVETGGVLWQDGWTGEGRGGCDRLEGWGCGRDGGADGIVGWGDVCGICGICGLGGCGGDGEMQ